MYNLDFNEFIEFYEKYGKTPNQINPQKNKLNEAQIRAKFVAYEKAEIKKDQKKLKKDERLLSVYAWVDERDNYSCRLLNKLSVQELLYVSNTNGVFLLSIIDHAHILPRSTHSYLKYDVDNIVLLSRLFHSRLDEFRDPITGEYIGKVMAGQWWQYILGSPQHDSLLKKLR